MTSTDYQRAHHRGAVDNLVAPDLDGPVPRPISSDRFLGSPKEAARWPGADRNAAMALALSLVAARADEDGTSYFKDLSERNPADAMAQALAGFFEVRSGHDVAAAITELDEDDGSDELDRELATEHGTSDQPGQPMCCVVDLFGREIRATSMMSTPCGRSVRRGEHRPA